MKATTLIVGLLALGAAAAAVSVATGASRTSGTTLHLVEKTVGFNYVDNRPLGGPDDPPTLGDMFALENSLWTKQNRRAGTLYASCVAAQGGVNTVMECTGTFALKGGELAAIATIHLNSGVTHIAIVGGTGAYEGARGSAISVSRGENSPYSDDTIHLLAG